MQLQNSSVGSGGIHVVDQRQQLLNNAKSLGNSLGTANKKSINMSNYYDKMLQGIATGDINQSTLNEG